MSIETVRNCPIRLKEVKVPPKIQGLTVASVNYINGTPRLLHFSSSDQDRFARYSDVEDLYGAEAITWRYFPFDDDEVVKEVMVQGYGLSEETLFHASLKVSPACVVS